MSIVPSDRDQGRNEMFDELMPPLLEGRVALARLCAVLNLDGLLSEGQLARITELDRVVVRALIDEGRDDLHNRPLTGEWGGKVMERLLP